MAILKISPRHYRRWGGAGAHPRKKKTKKNSSFTTINLDAFLKLPWDEFESYEVKSRTLPVAVSAVI